VTDQPSPRSELILYRTEQDSSRIQCRLGDETIWLTERLFQIGVATVNHHLKAISPERELESARYYALKDSKPRAIDTEFENVGTQLQKPSARRSKKARKP